MTEETDTTPVPPYMSFATLLNQIERMEREGTPSRIDRSYLVGMAGGTRNQFKMGLRSLGLIDESDQVTETLIRLAKDPDQRPAILAQILRERFPRLVDLDENATRGQLDDVLGVYGLGVDTRRKAASFFVAASTYAGINLSPHIRPAKGVNSGTSHRRVRPRPARRRPPADVPASAPKANDTAQMRRAYFDVLLSMAQQGSEDKDVLDRIEKLIERSDQDDDRGEAMT